MKKLISLFLAVLMMIGCCSIAFAEDAAATGRKGDQPVKFNENGKFKIMQINDTQDTDKLNKRTEENIPMSGANETATIRKSNTFQGSRGKPNPYAEIFRPSSATNIQRHI